MAEEVLSIKITADNSQAVAGLKQTETSMQNVSAAFKQQQNSVKALDTSTQEAISTNGKMNASLGEMKAYLKDLKAELNATVNPAQFKEVRTEIDNTSNSIKSLESKGGADGGFGAAIGGARKFQFILRSFAGVGLFAIFNVLYEGLNELALGFGRAEKLANKFQDSYLKGMSAAVGGAEAEAASVNSLVIAIEDESISRKHRQEALDSLKKSYPEYFDQQGIDIDNTLALEKANAALEESLVRRSKVQALVTLLSKAYESQAESEHNTLRQQVNSLSGWEKGWAAVTGAMTGFNAQTMGMNLATSLMNEGIKNNTANLVDARTNIASVTKELEKLTAEQVKNGDLSINGKKEKEITRSGNPDQRKQAKVTDPRHVEEWAVNEALKERLQLLSAEYDIIGKQILREKEKADLTVRLKLDGEGTKSSALKSYEEEQNQRLYERLAALGKIKSEQAEYNLEMSKQIQLGEGIANSMGHAIQAIASAKNPFEALTKALKQMVIDLAIAVAKMLIMKAIMAALNPGAKIGEVVGQAVAGTTPFATGGVVTGATNALIGEAGPEAVLPLDRLRSFVDQAGRTGAMAAMGGGGQSSGGSGEFTLRGNDLVLALQRSNYSLNLRR